MAQPLLKRTFSRLRGNKTSRRKTETQVDDAVAVPADVKVHKCGSPFLAMTSKVGEAAADPEPRSLSHMTMRQQWVWQGSQAPPTHSPADADGNTPKLMPDKATSQPAGGATDPSVGNKLSDKRAYLQSLDRSSRDWVLASTKSDASEKAGASWRESASHIWYNPIPEDEEQEEEEPERGARQGHACKDANDSTAESSDCAPTLAKKVAAMERLRSPGTVRKLSLKMKKLPQLRRRISLRSSRAGQGGDGASGSADKNQHVISRYHLDSSAPPALPLRRSSSKGGYLSDGDSPEPPARQASDVASFPLYVASEPSPCYQRVNGLLTVHLLGLDRIKSKESDESKDIFLAIQIDGTIRARTSLLNLQGHSLSLNHTFHLELERAWQLRVLVLRPARPESERARNRVCCLGGVDIPTLLKGSRSRQLCVQLEPTGLLYIKLSLQEQWQAQFAGQSSTPARVFGVELRHLVEEEGSPRPVPLLIQKTVAEIERRGLKTVGLYRLCGSAAVKKELRECFETDSSAVRLGEDRYPDVNVITGILKDYLRELPSSLMTAALYEAVKDAMSGRAPPVPPAGPDLRLAEDTVALLSCLPAAERATLTLLLDHLSLVASFSHRNRMTHQNLAVCFGPVLLKQTRAGPVTGGPRGGTALCQTDAAVDFKGHIEALHYLLQLWPVPTRRIPADDVVPAPPSPTLTHERPDHPALEEEQEEVVVSRRGRDGAARIDSPPPIKRYAGDWSICGRQLASAQEADYDEVAASPSSEDEEDEKEAWLQGGSRARCVEEVLDFDAPFNCRLSLKDFDSLINDLDRELAKHINICM
ncbi:rho GTPase-activating protein SYDE1 [Festucalex cinctus]